MQTDDEPAKTAQDHAIVHSPLPWSYGVTMENGEGPECVVLDRDNDCVCEVWDIDDAKLIVAAPDMLEILKRLVRFELPESELCGEDPGGFVVIRASHMEHEEYRGTLREAKTLIDKVK